MRLSLNITDYSWPVPQEDPLPGRTRLSLQRHLPDAIMITACFCVVNSTPPTSQARRGCR